MQASAPSYHQKGPKIKIVRKRHSSSFTPDPKRFCGRHESTCNKCGRSAPTVHCATCSTSWHIDCVEARPTQDGLGIWRCSFCDRGQTPQQLRSLPSTPLFPNLHGRRPPAAPDREPQGAQPSPHENPISRNIQAAASAAQSYRRPYSDESSASTAVPVPIANAEDSGMVVPASVVAQRTRVLEEAQVIDVQQNAGGFIGPTPRVENEISISTHRSASESNPVCGTTEDSYAGLLDGLAGNISLVRQLIEERSESKVEMQDSIDKLSSRLRSQAAELEASRKIAADLSKQVDVLTAERNKIKAENQTIELDREEFRRERDELRTANQEFQVKINNIKITLMG